MNNKQLLIGGIVFLFALNLFTIGFMLWNKKRHHRGKHHHKVGHFQPHSGCNMSVLKGYSCSAGSGSCSAFNNKKAGDKKHPNDRMAQILNLSEEQKVIMKEERKEHFSRIAKLKEEKRGIKKELFGLLKEQNVDSARMNMLLDEVAANERQEKEELIQHFIAIKKNLNKDQLAQFEKMIEKMNQRYHKRDSVKTEN